MKQVIYDAYCEILRAELVPAMGCTEPIAIAYCAALAARALGAQPEHILVEISGNIIKNASGVIVPNSGGRKGIAVAAVLGAVAGDADAQLQVLSHVTRENCDRAWQLHKSRHFCHYKLLETTEPLHIIVTAEADGHRGICEIRGSHTGVVRVQRDEKLLGLHAEPLSGDVSSPAQSLAQAKEYLNVRDILAFADTVQLDSLRDVLGAQIEHNSLISSVGLNNLYGANVGKTILAISTQKGVRVRARAAAAAGSDARMGGCALPVVINSGSGNQGLTVSLPVIEYARELGADEDKLMRALIVANLIAIHQKRYIGNLSAYCGATSAASGAACGIAYLKHLPYDVIAGTIINTITNIGGMVCDGAKPSCAAKIASALDAALMGLELTEHGDIFASGEGLVKDDVEKTIRAVGCMAHEGMKITDLNILRIMLEDKEGGSCDGS